MTQQREGSSISVTGWCVSVGEGGGVSQWVRGSHSSIRRVLEETTRPESVMQVASDAAAPRGREHELSSLEHTELPRDPSDPRYTMSFDPTEEDSIKSFFDEYGFVVVREVYDEDACDRTVDAMWEVCEELNPGLCRNDVSTWNALKASGKYGLSSRGPCFHSQLVRNRQSPRLARVLEVLIESEVLVSQDRFTIYRSTMLGGPGVATGPRNVHLDLNPWWWLESAEEVTAGVDTLQYENEQDFIKENNLVVKSMGRHVQCVLNFMDNVEADGGTIVVPKFHRYIAHWCEEHKTLKKPIPWLTMPPDTPLLSLAQRIPMKRGSVLLWDQTMFHGTSPNQSANCRAAQYLKAFPVSCVSAERLTRRSCALKRILEEKNFLDDITPSGLSVFALKGIL